MDPLETLFPDEFWPPARATDDVDLFLLTEVIVSAAHMRSVRAALDRLGYQPVVEFFQFARFSQGRRIKIDLLTCSVPEEHTPAVKVRPPRVRPRGDVQRHAYLTEEALSLGTKPCELTCRVPTRDGIGAAFTVHVPNPFTYLLMKLHALRDRIHDPRKNLAAHHALDLYRIVCMMSREEYDLTRSLVRMHAASGPVQTARRVVTELLANEDSLGARRLVSEARKGGMNPDRVRAGEFERVLVELLAEPGSE